MPFPIEQRFIEETESEMGFRFPPAFKEKMMAMNGGEVVVSDDDWQLFPSLDKSDNKRLSRTCNHIGLETANAREWRTFPPQAVAIGSNGNGDLLVLMPDEAERTQLRECIFIWGHETGELELVLNSIDEAES
jgi:hypothetical protein